MSPFLVPAILILSAYGGWNSEKLIGAMAIYAAGVLAGILLTS